MYLAIVVSHHFICIHALPNNTFPYLQFTKDVVGQLNTVKIDLRGIILLEAEGKQNLQDFSEAGLSDINYADYLEEVRKTRTYSTHTHGKTGKPTNILG